jgi:hypothetical protein
MINNFFDTEHDIAEELRVKVVEPYLGRYMRYFGSNLSYFYISTYMREIYHQA